MSGALRPIALTCGEPAGIGAEIAVLARTALPDLPFFWLGDPRHLAQGTPFAEISTPDQAPLVPKGVLPVLAHRFAGQAVAGKPDPANAQGVIDVISRAVDLVQSGQALALCTLPIHKKALQDGAGFAFPGHTEFLAHLAGGASVVMMLASEALRVVPATFLQ
jgi:4-hydroxythreonine-4-phosphate dehydrogenase